MLNGFPFSLYYRPEGEEIVIFAVSHHARYPSYWVGRTSTR